MTKIETSVPRYTPPETELKTGTDLIRKAYFKSWYDSCKDIYNKERRQKRKDKKRIGKDNGNSNGNPITRF